MYKLQPVITEFDIKGFNGIYYFEFGKNFSHTPEKHNFWEMVYVDSGNVLAITDGNSCILNQGQIIFHQPGEVHAHISDSVSPNNMLIISFTCDSKIMTFFKKKTFTVNKTSKTLLSLFINEARNSLPNLPDEYSDKRDLDFHLSEFGSTQLLLCYLTELLITLIRDNSNFDNKIVSDKASRAVAQNSLCELMTEFLKENIYKNYSLKDICNHFMIGKSQISSMFRASIGMSIMAYYNKLKIVEAKRLLREDRYSISEISEMLGFSCIHSFSRSFKNTVGVSPTVYKKRIL